MAGIIEESKTSSEKITSDPNALIASWLKVAIELTETLREASRHDLMTIDPELHRGTLKTLKNAIVFQAITFELIAKRRPMESRGFQFLNEN